MGSETDRVRIFCSYTHKDEALLRQLQSHLAALRRTNLIDTWNDRKIVPGTDWRTAIERELQAAHIVLLLVSADFINSEFCYSVELKAALERFDRGELLVIPIAMRPCDWKGTPLEGLQALPQDRRAVTTWSNRDLALENVAKGIRMAVEELSRAAMTRRAGVQATDAPATTRTQKALSLPLVKVLSRVFAQASAAPTSWLQTGLKHAESIALIRRRDGQGLGTGFVVDGRDLSLGGSSGLVLVTASFCVSNDPEDLRAGAARPEDVDAFFEIKNVTRAVGPVLWVSPVDGLKTTVLRLQDAGDIAPLQLGELPIDVDEANRLFVVGHPQAGPLSFSLWDGSWLDSDGQRVHYRAVTSGGSSGSPVFDEAWRVVAMHQAASLNLPRLHSNPGTYAACEGVLLQTLRQAITPSPKLE